MSTLFLGEMRFLKSHYEKVKVRKNILTSKSHWLVSDFILKKGRNQISDYSTKNLESAGEIVI